MTVEQALAELAKALREEIAAATSKPADPRPEQLSVAEYARRWSLSPSTVRAAIREKRLPITRVGRLIRIAADATIEKGSKHSYAKRADLVLLGGGKGR